MNDQEAVFPLPEQVLLADKAFARAYDQVGERGRALLKTAIAELYALHPPLDRTGSTAGKPLDYALILVGPGFASPVRLLAALLPALTAGVDNVLVVLAGRGRTRHSLLAACELAGQDRMASLTRRQSRNLTDELSRSAMRGAVVLLGLPREQYESVGSSRAARAAEEAGGEYRLVVPPEVDSLCLYQDREDLFDRDALEFAHPGTIFRVFGPARGVESGRFLPLDGDFETFLSQPHIAACGQKDRLEAMSEKFGLVLGPGREWCWAWPDIDWKSFSTGRIILAGHRTTEQGA